MRFFFFLSLSFLLNDVIFVLHGQGKQIDYHGNLLSAFLFLFLHGIDVGDFMTYFPITGHRKKKNKKRTITSKRRQNVLVYINLI